MMSSQGLAIAATAMAVSGTVVLFTLCRQKPLLLSLAPLSLDPTGQPHSLSLRPCIKNSIDAEKKREKKMKKKNGKKVKFSDQVEEFYFQAEAPKRRSMEKSCEFGPKCRPIKWRCTEVFCVTACTVSQLKPIEHRFV